MAEEKKAHSILGQIEEAASVRLLQEITHIPSYTGQEKAMAEYLGKRMESLGMDVEFQEVAPNRPNVIGRLKGKGGGRSLLFNGHMDHNMVCLGWTKDPFGGEIEEGWLYGVGVGNMKAGNAGYLVVLEAIVKSGVVLAGDVIIEYVVGELEGGTGTRHAVAQGVKGDMFVLGEPSQLHVRTRLAGSVQLKIKTFGQMRHFSTEGPVNHAIENMCKIIRAVGPSHMAIQQRGVLTFVPKPGFEGLPRWNVAAIRGGMTEECLDWRPALVPDFCSTVVDVRILPGQSINSVIGDFQALFSRLATDNPGFRAEVEPHGPYPYVPPCDMGTNTPLMEMVKEAHRVITGSQPELEERSSYAFSDAVHLAQAGMQGVEYGPGGGSISTPAERVSIKDYLTAAKVYALVAAEACGVAR